MIVIFLTNIFLSIFIITGITTIISLDHQSRPSPRTRRSWTGSVTPSSTSGGRSGTLRRERLTSENKDWFSFVFLYLRFVYLCRIVCYICECRLNNPVKKSPHTLKQIFSSNWDRPYPRYDYCHSSLIATSDKSSRAFIGQKSPPNVQNLVLRIESVSNMTLDRFQI